MQIELSVFFEDPFWIGVFERVEGKKLSVCKVTFGAEPKDSEVYEFVLSNYYKLLFSPSVEATVRKTAENPKRKKREAEKQLKNVGIGTKSQQALKLQREAMKVERREISKEERDAEKERQFELKRQKRKEKHKGH